MIYDLCYFLLKCICGALFRLKAVGEENVPKSGPVILASNHVSYLDPIFLGVSLPRRIHYMAKEEIFRNPLAGWFLRSLQAFPVSRQKASSSTIRKALELMKRGRVLLLFPEGTRGDGKTLQRAKPGIAIIAERSGAPLIPVYLHGAEKVLPRGSRWFRLHPVTVGFGVPVFPGSSSSSALGEHKKGHYEDLMSRVMVRIEEMKNNMEQT